MEWSSAPELATSIPAQQRSEPPAADRPLATAPTTEAVHGAPLRARHEAGARDAASERKALGVDGTARVPGPGDRRPGDAVPAARPATPPTEPAAESMDLADQNTLFAQAKRARSLGDKARANALLNDLVHRFPASPLAEDAHVEIFRALALDGDAAGAAREARHYLALYPNGFARDEAHALTLDSRPVR
jgi:hypothetical protein